MNDNDPLFGFLDGLCLAAAMTAMIWTLVGMHLAGLL
jgi:hypothetical protein